MSSHADRRGAEGSVEQEAGAPEEGVLDLVLVTAPRERIEGVIIGTLVHVGDEPLVGFEGAPAAGVPARSTVELGPGDEGRAVALVFELGNPERPIVLGKMAQGRGSAAPAKVVEAVAVEVRREEGRLLLEAEDEIVLRCGEASITLTRAGKVLIRGAYVLSHAEGANRIRGGVVEIN